ncbi:hypothetical protein GCM10009069_02090 [Algimonas arctica]|uniref:Uncharacterized protein n=1 Tax=Algimonas arctica TaxID=1479486 RepID=A0A8J3FZR1_9PROT|nr:hypothetical protein [Algimonas arctica]GHA82507.1 hypothetical protein GCM10009069_02090 [Algimonas arctica]
MSDISQKIFSIEPEPDEDPIALVPEAPDAKGETVSKSDSPPLLRTIVDIPAPLNRPIFELVETIDDDDEETPERITGPALNDTKIEINTLENKVLDPDAGIENHPSEHPDFITAIIKPISASSSAPVLKRPMASPPETSHAAPAQPAYSAPAAPATARLGWVGPIMTGLTGLAIGALVFAYITESGAISPIGLAGLIMAIIVPMMAVIALWATLRALRANREETLRLAEVADRLTRADESVTSDVARMSSAIKRELAQVDSRLAQSRDELDTLVALITRQSIEMNGMTQRLTDRSETIAKTVTDQRDAFTDLSTDFDTRMTALIQNIKTQRDALDASGEAAAKRVGEASDALDHATKLTEGHGDAIATAATTAHTSITAAETRLSSLSERIKAQAEELDDFYERRTQQLSDLSERLTNDKGLAETALYSQTEKLGAVDAQLEITESRLTDLLDHAGQVQAQLTARLSDIDSTLSDADKRSRAFTADIADRVSDSVAQTRREISIMESELRALQSRMDGAKSADLALPPQPKTLATPKRVHFTPLDTDFPSLDQDDLSIPEDDDDDTLDLVEAIIDEPFDIVTHAPEQPDVIRRPGEVDSASRGLSRGKPEKTDKNWRWRDMLGSIDPITEPDFKSSRLAPPRPASAVDRPGPGVPLRAPPPRAPEPEGSDVVARLCEVKLAPSAMVDDGTISEAEAARQSGGEAAQSEAVFARLNSPIIHLRGVLSADLEFRLRAEGFRRSYNSYLSDITESSRLRAELASANGRAYLLCAAALSAS